MNALILAAGRGRRIEELTQGMPKCFLEVGGKRIIEHQIDACRNARIDDIVIVTGWRASEVEAALNSHRATFIRNPFFDRTNVLSSVWFAAPRLREGFYFMHADTLFDPSILVDLREHPGDLVLCVETKSVSDEEMKVRLVDGTIQEINKTMDLADAQGEFTGVLKVSPALAPTVVDTIEHFIEIENRVEDFFEVVIQDLIDRGIGAEILDIGDRISIEIDFPEDYEEAVARLGQSAGWGDHG